MKMDQFVALTIGQALMKKEIQRANAASELLCRYKVTDKMSFHDFRSSSALDALRLKKKPEVLKTGGASRESGKITPKLTSQTDQKRKNEEDSAKVDLVRAKMGNLPLVQREELRSLVDNALRFLEKADNCSMQTVYGSVVTLNRVTSSRAQYSFRDVQSMLRFGVKMGVCVLEGSWYRLVNEPRSNVAIEDPGMEDDDQVVDHWEAERDIVENSIRQLRGVKSPPSVRRPKPTSSSASLKIPRPSSVPQVATSADSVSPTTTVKAGFFKRQPKAVTALPSISESMLPAAMLSPLVQDQRSASPLGSSATVVSPTNGSLSDVHEDAQWDSFSNDIRSKTNGHTGSLEQSLIGAVITPSGSSGFFQRQSNVICATPSSETVSPVTLDVRGTPNPVSIRELAACAENLSPGFSANCGFFKRQPNEARASPSPTEAVGTLTEAADVSPVPPVVPSTSGSNSSAGTKFGFFKRFCRMTPSSATAPIT